MTEQEARQIAAPDAWPWPVSKEAGDWIRFATLEHNAFARRAAVGAQMQACESESPAQQRSDVGAAAGGEFDREAHEGLYEGVVMELESIRDEARREIKEESFRHAVEAEKARLRMRKPWWHRLVPFTITIARRVK